MNDVELLRWGALYLGVHFLVYILVLRYVQCFSFEKTIFLYHALSALALGGLLAILTFLMRSVTLASPVALMSLHGIYSLSFLELWSLTQGSYSLSILTHVDDAKSVGMPLGLAELRGVGAWKKRGRIESLQRLWLLRRQGEHFGLTALGHLAALGFRAVAEIVNLKK
jgi:hypothetical protein